MSRKKIKISQRKFERLARNVTRETKEIVGDIVEGVGFHNDGDKIIIFLKQKVYAIKK